ncbi:hypothetical protein HFP51_01455 [Parasphingopyxis sp. CP4]|uniref:hypothetical protein n=1 Tax=Parasphingopyxis sp. CP4 TaxID=2724527 RepID=UPI0015A2D703|nr:hypothetical protein [Parasphingopyxis sp. CP4]QLC20967.1 hypothetical protein HFP51_01455 [Parasphingopyxis sp. CP4]
MKFSLEAIRDGATVPDLLGNLPKIPVASAVSGLIVAALILMTPNSWFEAFVTESGLPGLISAAEPPLGARARIVFALAAALMVTLIAWGALSATVGRKMRQRAEARREAENTEFDPDVRARALRRGDAHPDAPYRRPIMATDDLGTALDDVDVEAAMDEEADGDALDLGAVAEILGDAPEAEAEGATEEAGFVAETVDMDSAPIADDASSETIFEVPLPRRDEAVVQPSPTAAEPEIRGDLAELVGRLEAGLKRKRAKRTLVQDIPENVATHPQARPAEAQDEALKEALDALQQVSGKAS